MTTITYTARVSRRDGRKVYETIPFTSREEAARVAFAVRPTAKTCSTCRGIGCDIRWHRREEIMGRAQP